MQGSFNLLHLILCILTVCVSRKDKEGILSLCLNCCNLIFILFLIAWTIAGSMWLLRLPVDLPCNDALYFSALTCLSFHYGIVLLLCCCCSCAICKMCIDSLCEWTKITSYTHKTNICTEHAHACYVAVLLSIETCMRACMHVCCIKFCNQDSR